MAKQLVVIQLCLIGFFSSKAQSISGFKQLRYEEDYSILQQDSSKNWYTATKFKALSKNGSTYLSMGGDIRYQYQRFTNENWGESAKDKDGFILTRYLAHADFHAGKHFRTFVQLQSSFANGKATPPSPVDENQLDLHQAFADIVFTGRPAQALTIRVGRQELLYGSQRLVAVRDGPNNRQSFDAARLIYTHRTWNGHLFYSRFVQSKQLIFDDGFTNHTRFWGAYLVKNRVPWIHHADVYYFGLWRKNARFDDGIGKERRHSIGGRIWDTQQFWRYDIEGLYQFGDFAGKQITAWTFSVNAGYKFAHTRLKPEPGIKAELISGDAQYGDNKLQTFNPLFPRGGYFGLVSIIGPANLIDVHPSLALELAHGLYFNMDYDIFWRYSRNDGIYGPNVALIYSGRKSSQRSIGRQYSTHLEYIPNPFLYFRGEFTWFKASDFLHEAGTGKNILFAAVTAQLRF